MADLQVIVVIRHNTHLETDVSLAIRELNSLAGCQGLPLATPAAVAALLPGCSAAALPVFPTGLSVVALHFHRIDAATTLAVANRSAFAQEIFVSGDSAALSALHRRCRLPCHLRHDVGSQVLVLVSFNYLLETEGVAGDRISSPDRLRQVGQELLRPFTSIRPSPLSRTLRHAKKTTLSLTHDLHIYKAKFFPRMVRALLNIFAPTEQADILDPFLGSGTTLLEGSLLGHNSYGVDIDPVCTLVSCAKVEPFLDSRQVHEDVSSFRDRISSQPKDKKTNPHFPEELRQKLQRRDARDSSDWLPEVQRDVERLRRALATYNGDMQTPLPRVLASDAVTKKVRYRYIGVGNGKYTIEVVKTSILERVAEKAERYCSMADVFASVQQILPWKLGRTVVRQGDARRISTWPKRKVDVILTSPPYLPASSGREHYATSRALAFHTLGLDQDATTCFDPTRTTSDLGDGSLASFPEAVRLMDYLLSDTEAIDPQRDPMRHDRKARPTKAYLEDMLEFFRAARSALKPRGVLLLVVASQHTFYSHRRGEVEHVVRCAELYRELAASCGLAFQEEVRMELLKASNTRARPRAKDQYYESVLVFT